VKGFFINDPGNDLQPGQVIGNDGYDFGPKGFQVLKIIRAEDAQFFSQDAVPHLNGGPGGKIIGIGPGNVFMAEQETMGMVIDGIEGNFFDGLQELSLIAGAPGEHLAELPAAHKDKRIFSRTVIHV
jgi:hypothetical protein